jgi:hypothetical protein
VLAVAAADTDDRVRVIFSTPADQGAIFPVRFAGDGAGVDDVAVAVFIKPADLMTPVPEQLLHGLGLILVYLTAEGMKSKSHRNTTIGKIRDIISLIPLYRKNGQKGSPNRGKTGKNLVCLQRMTSVFSRNMIS